MSFPRRDPDSGALSAARGRAGATVSRRGLLAVGGALGAGALLGACGGGGEGEGSSGGSGSWSFKDDRGETAKADARPKKIVGYVGSAAALHDLGVECTAVFGPLTYRNGDLTPQAGSLDPKKVTSLSTGIGSFNIERYAALGPDLLVSNVNQPPQLWSIPPAGAKKVLRLAPSVGIVTAKVSLTQCIQRYGELAQALGADMKATKVTEAKERFERAAERLRKAAKAKRGLKVLAAAAQPDFLSAGSPTAFPDTYYYAKELGVDFVVPRKPGQGGFWEPMSWENADTYDADVLFMDARPNNMPTSDLAEAKPIWNKLPAVEAGQVVSWNNEAQFSHAGYAPLIERLADALEKAKKVT